MRVVVGVDTSAESRAVLRVALDEAELRAAELLVVHVWDAGFDTVHRNDVVAAVESAAVTEALQLVHDLVAGAQAERRRPVDRVVPLALQGDAAEVLLGQVLEGDLLVIGANSGGVVRRLVLGSVCSKVVQAARTPVLVVPAATGS